MKTFAALVFGLVLSTQVLAASSSNITTIIKGDRAQAIASVLLAGQTGRYVEVGANDLPTYDHTKDYLIAKAITCDFSNLISPSESAVIQSVSCQSGKKKLSNALALVVAMQGAGISETSNNGPSAVNPWESHYEIKGIKCSGLVQPETLTCTVVMAPESED